MAEREIELWVKFFREAGIPPGTAADYAITFNDNRIQRNMLLDLNREILKEMGITLMGDVIAILRHAKTVHDKTARERILSVQSSPRKSGSRGQKDPPEIQSKTKKHNPAKEEGKQALLPISQDRAEIPIPKKRAAPPHTERTSRQEEQQIINMDVDEIQNLTPAPVKKARMVLPEHEGGYRITMPSGTTPRSRAILSMVAAKQSKQKHRVTVFDRLGECVVSSTTGGGSPVDERAGSGTTVITVTGVSSSPNKTVNSVFSRLGGKHQLASSTLKSTPPGYRGRIDGSGPGQLPYAGILKKNANSPTRKGPVIIKQRKTGTMRADEATENAKDRLGSKQDNRKGCTPVEPSVVRKILSTTGRILSTTGKMSAGILSNPDNATTRNVKTRLGVTQMARQPLKQSSFRQRITGPSNGTTAMKIAAQASASSDSFNWNFRPQGTNHWRGRGGRFPSRTAARPDFRH